jgi:hypothetical protein
MFLRFDSKLPVMKTRSFAWIRTMGLLLGAASMSYAGNLTISTSSGRKFTSQAGTPLNSGCCIRVGSFELTATNKNQVLANTKDFSQLNAWFKPLAENKNGSGTTEQTGSSNGQLRMNHYPVNGDVFGTITDILPSYIAADMPVYVWVFDAATPEQAQQWGIFTASNWQVPPDVGALTLTTSGTLQAIQGSVTSTQLQLQPIPSTYLNWAMKKFGSTASAQATDVSADSDGDGLKNLMEYAWGLNPASRDSARSAINASGTPYFEFQVPRLLPDVTVQAECSTNMVNWTVVSSTLISTTDSYETRRVTSPNGNRCFWRVKFSQN